MGSTDRKLLYPIMYNIIKHRTFNSRLHNAVIYESFFNTLLIVYEKMKDELISFICHLGGFFTGKFLRYKEKQNIIKRRWLKHTI